MRQKNKLTFFIILTAAILLIGGISIYKFCYRDNGLLYSQEYTEGSANIKGSVDVDYFSDKGAEFEIGANRYGYAVFKNPDAAFTRLKKDFIAGIEQIREEFNLAPLSQGNFEEYGIYGWQVALGTKEEKEQARFVTSFMDIYENSYRKQ